MSLSNEYTPAVMLGWLAEPGQSNLSTFGRQLMRSAVLLGRQTVDSESATAIERSWELQYEPRDGGKYTIKAAFKALGEEGTRNAYWQLIVQQGDRRVLTGFDARHDGQNTQNFTMPKELDPAALKALRSETEQNIPFLDRKQAKLTAC